MENELDIQPGETYSPGSGRGCCVKTATDDSICNVGVAASDLV